MRYISRLLVLTAMLLTVACDRKGKTSGPPAAPGGVPPAKAQTVGGALDLNVINMAATRFIVDLNRPPKDIAELVKENYLAASPALPVGQRLVLDPQTKQFRIAGP
ncbi:MAG: hypothetical protein EXS27_01130 [Pedosphaera sp.]|nr:hypothetical protein [Pedosphaera sp.]